MRLISDPVIGTWPQTHDDAEHYFFDPDQLGGRRYRAMVDGEATPLDRHYLVGPVRVARLGDGGGHHIITLAAFIKALPVGEHTVRIVGRLAGRLINADPLDLTFSESTSRTK